MNSKTMKYITNATTVFFLSAMAIFLIYGIQTGLFTSKEQLQMLISHAGYLGPALFILIQFLQVVFPIVPGGITCLAGVFMFGPLWGFLYSYIGIIAGSFTNFYLARRYGETFVKKIVSPEIYDKYMDKLNSGK